MSDISLEDLKKNATPNETEVTEPESEDVVEESNIPSASVDPRSGIKDPLQAALEREEARKKAEQEAAEEAERERKNDGREYEYEVNGINLGDSLVRRLNTANENVRAMQEVMAQEDLEREAGMIEDEIDELDDDVEEIKDIEEDDMFKSEDVESLDVDDENVEEEYIFSDSNDDELKSLENEIVEENKMEVEAKNTETVENVEDTEVLEEEMEDAYEAEQEPVEETAIAPEKEEVVDKVSKNDLPSQSDMTIDDDDLLDIDLDDEDEESGDDDLSEAEMDNLREQIKDKLGVNSKPIEGMKVVKKVISLSAALSKCSQDMNAVDWPLMSAGKNVTMKAFSGTEIDALNRGASGRNRFNTMKEIYRSIYDHIVSEKPDFEAWLKTTSFMDIEHLYMAIYKASFNNANYIPYNCTDEKCNHVFLSDDIDIMDMCKFKNADAKKRFMAIYENDRTATSVEEKLYPTTIVNITDSIAIGFREPSIYNTIFENSVLDAKFVDKYTSLLTMMVYIDAIYVIDGNNYVPISCKKDKQSVAKTTKYRIATYAKIIQALPSDGYNKIVGIISQINELGDEVQYRMPEITCPKCGKTIEEQVTQANQLLFSRHQLNLLSQQ